MKLDVKEWVAKVTEALKIDKQAYAISYGNTYWEFRKRGDVCYLQTGNFPALPAGNFNIGTLPAAFRPQFTISWTLLARTSSVRVPIAVVIETNGTIRGYNYGSATSSVMAGGDSLCYPLD